MSIQQEPAVNVWTRAHHMTRWGIYEIRLRSDGDYDIRAVGDDRPCDRGVNGGYVCAEFCIDNDCDWLVKK